MQFEGERMPGLDIDEKQFQQLSTRQQLLVIFRNTQDVKAETSSMRFHQKVQYVLITCIYIGITYLATKVFG